MSAKSLLSSREMLHVLTSEFLEPNDKHNLAGLLESSLEAAQEGGCVPTLELAECGL